MRAHDYTIYDYICRNAQLYPDHACIIFNDIRLSHKEYKVRCDRLAAGLVKFGIAKGDRLGIVAHNSDVLTAVDCSGRMITGLLCKNLGFCSYRPS